MSQKTHASDMKRETGRERESEREHERERKRARRDSIKRSEMNENGKFIFLDGDSGKFCNENTHRKMCEFGYL